MAKCRLKVEMCFWELDWQKFGLFTSNDMAPNMRETFNATWCHQAKYQPENQWLLWATSPHFCKQVQYHFAALCHYARASNTPEASWLPRRSTIHVNGIVLLRYYRLSIYRDLTYHGIEYNVKEGRKLASFFSSLEKTYREISRVLASCIRYMAAAHVAQFCCLSTRCTHWNAFMACLHWHCDPDVKSVIHLSLLI